jgi:hypothetical protein
MQLFSFSIPKVLTCQRKIFLQSEFRKCKHYLKIKKKTKMQISLTGLVATILTIATCNPAVACGKFVLYTYLTL